jgi:hypothetical protein
MARTEGAVSCASRLHRGVTVLGCCEWRPCSMLVLSDATSVDGVGARREAPFGREGGRPGREVGPADRGSYPNSSSPRLPEVVDQSRIRLFEGTNSVVSNSRTEAGGASAGSRARLTTWSK